MAEPFLNLSKLVMLNNLQQCRIVYRKPSCKMPLPVLQAMGQYQFPLHSRKDNPNTTLTPCPIWRILLNSSSNRRNNYNSTTNMVSLCQATFRCNNRNKPTVQLPYRLTFFRQRDHLPRTHHRK